MKSLRNATICLGDLARDAVSGFEGVVVAAHQYLHGCRRLSIQPQHLHDGKPIEPQTFDEPQIVLLESRRVTGVYDVGGPRTEPSRPRVPVR
jgi:hypothetical protein